MLQQRAYKYRFYPTEDQKRILLRTFGSARFVYNWGLALRTDTYKSEGKNVSFCGASARLTELKRQPDTIWLNDISSVVLQQALRRLDKAFTNFFRGRAKYPKFKKRKSRQSVTYTSGAFSWNGETLRLAKMAEPLRIRWSRRFEGQPSSVTVSLDSSGRYFVSFLVSEGVEELSACESVIGIDLGIKDTITLNTGRKVRNPRFFHRDEKKLARYQRRLSRKKLGSKNRQKARKKVAKIHVRIVDRRTDFLRKLSTQLIRENQTIVVETLRIKNMLADPRLAKAIADAGWGEFLRMLQYKSKWYGRQLIKIDRYYPSSKRCHICGWIKQDLTLDTRSWTCPLCGAWHDRDINAACNILAAGLAVSASGETVSPGPIGQAGFGEGRIPRLRLWGMSKVHGIQAYPDTD